MKAWRRTLNLHDLQQNFSPISPPRKGKTKVPKDLDKSKSSFQTPLLLDNIMFEGTHLKHMTSLKFEYWDLNDYEKFPHLETRNLMKPKQNTVVGVTEIQLRKWLNRVDKAGLLNFLWVPHFHRALITIFVIRRLLYLVHDGCLWPVELIPITTDLIHHVS